MARKVQGPEGGTAGLYYIYRVPHSDLSSKVPSADWEPMKHKGAWQLASPVEDLHAWCLLA